MVLGIGANAYAIDPSLSLDQNVVRTWGIDQGLPQSTVFGVAQSSDGYIWAATQEGFVRFDGTEFVVFDKATAAEIHNNIVTAVVAARDGSVYAATDGGGVIRTEGKNVTSYTTKDGLPSDAVTSLYESGNGTIWIGTKSGLARRQSDGHIVTVPNTESLAVTAMTED